MYVYLVCKYQTIPCVLRYTLFDTRRTSSPCQFQKEKNNDRDTSLMNEQARMNIPTLFLCLADLAVAISYTMRAYAPDILAVHDMAINANRQVFTIGSDEISDYCGLRVSSTCPPGNETLIDEGMKQLKVQPLGNIVYLFNMR
jgi:hypothetical protein